MHFLQMVLIFAIHMGLMARYHSEDYHKNKDFNLTAMTNRELIEQSKLNPEE